MVTHRRMPLKTSGVRVLWNQVARPAPSYSTHPQSPHAARASFEPELLPEQAALLYTECYPLSKKIKVGKEGKTLTCAQNYKLSVGKIIFV